MSTTPAHERRTTGGGRGTRGRRLRPVWKWTLGTTGGLLLLGAAGAGVAYATIDVPDPNEQAVLQGNVWKAADGTVLARTGEVNRENVALDDVPEDVRTAFVAAENKGFYSDSGVDLVGTARGVANTLRGEGRQGGSTITQQYVKNYYLNQEQTVSRKAQEIIIALKVDQQMSKDDILEGYLNTSYFGRNAYGIQSAAQAYFDKDAEQLTVPEGAYLASLLQAPSRYDLATATAADAKRAEARWDYTLGNMVDLGALTERQREAAEFPELADPDAASGLGGQTGYLVQAATRYLTSSGTISDQELSSGGYTITLTIDPEKQKALTGAVKSRLTDRLDPERREVDGHVQAGSASVDPETGDVVALYGGTDYTEHYTDNATRTDYQAASTFKPIVLAAALENGATTRDGRPIAPGTVYDGSNRRPVQGSPTPFAPPNEDEVDYGDLTVQRAMNSSVNSVFAQMAVDAGLQSTVDTAKALGLPAGTPGLSAYPAVSLGTATPSAVQVAGVYATFANHGKLVVPTLVDSASKGGQEIELPTDADEGEQVVKRTTADTVTQVLRGVVQDGSGRTASQLGREVAGKTGTSDDNRSAWFAGYTPELATAVGLFGEKEQGGHTSLHGLAGGGRVNGSSFPADIWTRYTRDALAGSPAKAFDLKPVAPVRDAAPAEPTDKPTPSPSATPSTTPTPSATPSQTPSDTATTEPPADTADPTDPTDPTTPPEPPDPSDLLPDVPAPDDSDTTAPEDGKPDDGRPATREDRR